MKNKTNAILICTLIGLCFLWTSSGYLTWMYHLLNFYPATSVDIYTEIVGYLFQILGLFLVSLCSKKNFKLFSATKTVAATFLLDLFFIFLSALAPNGLSALFFGYLMNLFHGLIAGIYLTRLVTRVSQQNKGIVFGLGYGLGSVGTWMISLIGQGNFLKSNYVFLIYIFLTFLSIFLFYVTGKESAFEDVIQKQSYLLAKSVFVLVVITVFLLSYIKNTSFYFPTADLSKSSISLEFARAFYAIGLIIAGIINDKNRKWGAVCCVAALVFPFAMLILKNNLEGSLILWILNYIFFGLFSVYRVIIFADLAGKSTQYLYLSGLGLLCGRCGDVAGTAAGIFLSNHIVIFVISSSVLFMITIFLFINLYQRIYMPNLSEKKSRETLLVEFEQLYQFSPRETEVFRLIIEGSTNTEIAEYLFISENTVKFHMKNILKKTACPNRTSLIKLFKEQ